MAEVSFSYFFRRYRWDYGLGVFFLLATNLLAARIPLDVKAIIDALQGFHVSHAQGLLLQIIILVVCMYGVRILSRYFLLGVGRKVDYDVRLSLFKHLLALPRSFYDVRQTGELMSRLTNDLTALRMLMGGGIMLLVNVVFAYFTILPLITMLSWRLTLFAFVLYPLVVWMMRGLSLKLKVLFYQVQDCLGGVTAVAQENFSGISVIQSYAKEAEESTRFLDTALGYFHANTRLVKVRALLYILIAVVSGLSVLIILGEGGREVIVGELTLSGFTAFMLYLERLSWPTVSFGWILSSFQQGLAAKERINEILQTPLTVTDQKANFELTTLPPGPIEVRNLSFRYVNPYNQTATESEPPWVLRDISFDVHPGELVAVVGPIGSGKSTLLNLLVRLYEPPENTIFIDNIPVEQYPLLALRGGMTLMPQSSFLFSSTVKNNIAYHLSAEPFEHIIDAAQAAHIHPEIMGFPHQYQTLVGERGVTLSGGQRQRTALARTILMKPDILLLDDPFSNVDVETEQMIIQALKDRQILYQRTTLFASQRFSLVREADRIVVLNTSGAMEGIGTHQELLNTCSLYRQLNKLDEDAVNVGQEGVSL